jgi:hypothetical protein
MKINRLFTFDVHLINELNNRIPRGKRSGYVNDALEYKLLPDKPSLLRDSTSGRILAELRKRDDVSDFLKKAIELELKHI